MKMKVIIFHVFLIEHLEAKGIFGILLKYKCTKKKHVLRPMGLYEENSLRIKITRIKGKNITEERFIYVHILM